MADQVSHNALAVVHLIRKSNGLVPFQRFLKSYKAHPDPLSHDLVLIFKDFGAGEDKAYLSLLEDVPYVRYDFLGDGGLDIGPYVEVSRNLSYKYFCFLNSFSEIECDNWLSHLFNGLQASENAGVVGATGSWESSSETDPEFPNPHIRTNGFLISAATMAKIQFIEIKGKDDAREVESGFESLTRQVIEQGRLPYVVDRHGVCWSIEKWHESATFRSGGQKGIIISDNRTRAYASGDAWTKEYLYDMAWTGQPSKANPFKRHKLRHRLRRFLECRKAVR